MNPIHLGKLVLCSVLLIYSNAVFGQACTHQGQQVICPDGVAPGTNSSFFDGPDIVWEDGTRTPVSACCSPFEPPMPTMPDPEADPGTINISDPPATTPQPDPTPSGTPETTPASSPGSSEGKENINLKGPLDESEEMRKFNEEMDRRSRERKKLFKETEKDLEELNDGLKIYLEEVKEVFLSKTEDKVAYCGPDITVAFLDALNRVKKRVEALDSIFGNSAKGAWDGMEFLENNGTNNDFWAKYSDWKGTAKCPSLQCASSDPCYTFNGRCFPLHVFSDIAFGFMADQVEVSEFVAKAGGAHHEGGKKTKKNADAIMKQGDTKARTMTFLSVMEDMGIMDSATLKSLQLKEIDASVASYKFGDELSEDFENIKNQNDINKDDFKALTDGVYASWKVFKDCKICPDKTPINIIFKDFSTKFWIISDKKQCVTKDKNGKEKFILIDSKKHCPGSF